MSDLWFNLRLWDYHIQAGRREWWRFQFSRNSYHRENNWPDGYISLYDFSTPRSYIGGYPAARSEVE